MTTFWSEYILIGSEYDCLFVNLKWVHNYNTSKIEKWEPCIEVSTVEKLEHLKWVLSPTQKSEVSTKNSFVDLTGVEWVREILR